MDRQQLEANVDRRMMPLRVISIALAGSVVFHAVLGWVLVATVLGGPMVPLPLAARVSVALVGLALILVGYLAGRKIRNAGAERTAGAARTVDAALDRYTRSVIVAAAIREAAAVVGLVLTVLTAEPIWVLLLAAATLISMTVHWPRRAAVVDWLVQQRMVG